MRVSKLLALLVVIALVLTGIHCKKSTEPTDETVSFVGSWVATEMVYDATAANPLIPVTDVILLGASLSITVNEDDTYDLILVQPGADPDPDDGNFAVDETNKIITMTSNDPEEGLLVFTYSLDGNIMTLVTDDVFFPPGTEIPAILTIKLKKVA